jgi:hypothetical protein
MNWDTFSFPQLNSKESYLSVLSVVLCEALCQDQQIYDHKLITDILSNQKSQVYSIESLRQLIADVKKFSLYWAQTTTFHVTESQHLLDIFSRLSPTFFQKEEFGFLKTHWLKDRIHRPLLSILSLRAKEWMESAPYQAEIDVAHLLKKDLY